MVEHVHGLQKGYNLHQYTIERILGAGGFGITYLAHDKSLDIKVAIKEYLPSDLAIRHDDSRITAQSTSNKDDFEWGLKRFMDEAKILAKFHHENIVHVLQVIEENNTAYIVMEYIEGEALSELIAKKAPLDEQQVRGILFPILDGLQQVHAANFLHRDIKPANIILHKESGPVLIDFGAARQAIVSKSQSITSIITEGYAPLEQYDPNGNQGPWTDIHALGAVAYKCFTGETPPAATLRTRTDPLIPLADAAPGKAEDAFFAAIEWALRVYDDMRPQTISEWRSVFSGEQAAPDAPVIDLEATRKMDDEATKIMSSRLSQAGKPNQNKTSTKIMAIVGIIVIIAAAGSAWMFMGYISPEDTRAWQIATRDDTVTAYEAYNRLDSNGHYIPQSSERIAEIKSLVGNDWKTAVSADTIQAYETFRAKNLRHNMYSAETSAAIKKLEQNEQRKLADNTAWQTATKDDTVEAYEAYNRLDSNGNYVHLASDRIAEINNFVDNDWNTAVSADTIQAYEAFRDKNLKHNKYLIETSDAIKRLEKYEQRKLADNTAWQAATSSNTVKAYQLYLTSYSDGQYIEDARNKITAFETAERLTLAQRALKNSGHYSGSINGVNSEATIKAVSAWQGANGLQVTGILDNATSCLDFDKTRSLFGESQADNIGKFF